MGQIKNIKLHIVTDIKMNTIRLALIQSRVYATKEKTLNRVSDLVHEAASNHAKLICLPECFNCPYGVQHFSSYAEKIPGKSSSLLSSLAKDLNLHLIGGSFPEEEDGKIFNTCLVYGPDGLLLGKHRKVHLFDIDIPGGQKFKESDVLSPGNDLTMVQMCDWKIGIGICYDLRFFEMSAKYASRGCQLLVYPGAFNMTTGPKHWELLIRARANDHQSYIAACAPARDEDASYVSWANSTICNPWGEVVAKAGSAEEIIYADLDMNVVDTVRTAIPISKQKRNDVYEK